MTQRLKISDLAAQLGISATTISNWINEFSQHFSDHATLEKGRRRLLDENDVLILATISKLSHEGRNYSEIRDELANGYRVESPADVNYGVNRAVVPQEAVKSLIDATQIKAQLEAAERERDRVLDELTAERDRSAAKDDQINELQKQIAELQRALGKAEGRLEELDKKPRRWFGGV